MLRRFRPFPCPARGAARSEAERCTQMRDPGFFSPRTSSNRGPGSAAPVARMERSVMRGPGFRFRSIRATALKFPDRHRPHSGPAFGRPEHTAPAGDPVNIAFCGKVFGYGSSAFARALHKPMSSRPSEARAGIHGTPTSQNIPRTCVPWIPDSRLRRLPGWQPHFCKALAKADDDAGGKTWVRHCEPKAKQSSAAVSTVG
jgi:hypothetical protein